MRSPTEGDPGVRSSVEGATLRVVFCHFQQFRTFVADNLKVHSDCVWAFSAFGRFSEPNKGLLSFG